MYRTVPWCVLEQGSPLPVLVMEFPVCLSGEVWCPAQEISYRILHDLAVGMVYLHEHFHQ